MPLFWEAVAMLEMSVHEPNPEMMPKNDFRSTPFGTKLFWYQIEAYWLYFMN